MTGDRDGLRERLRIDGLRDGVDPGALRKCVGALRTWAFIPPRYTDDELGADRVAAGAEPSPSGNPEYGGFDLAEWLDVESRADATLPGTVPDETGSGSTSSTVDDSSAGPYGIPSECRPDAHPTRVATLALFVTAATLAVLTAAGVLPPLGPAAGLPA